ncbi:hypothetical protein [Streptomyces sp. NBC_01483]|uniref:hypothetical protein n=1 Tax=Streptomyces sp. NBC_01483 TaxID=2903883 RepID=UPI002E36163E|nr:hypothetical protein [Streptomyces sp. NBC_01483]
MCSDTWIRRPGTSSPSPAAATPPYQLQDLIRSALQDRARQSLAADLVLPRSVDGPLVPLTEFAVEETALTGVIDDAEVSRADVLREVARQGSWTLDGGVETDGPAMPHDGEGSR